MTFEEEALLRRAMRKHKRLIKSLERNAKLIRELWRHGLRKRRNLVCRDCGQQSVPQPERLADLAQRPQCPACGSTRLWNINGKSKPFQGALN
jgi:Zn finger protein HypA/HybF involved in hydrogenase expression